MKNARALSPNQSIPGQHYLPTIQFNFKNVKGSLGPGPVGPLANETLSRHSDYGWQIQLNSIEGMSCSFFKELTEELLIADKSQISRIPRDASIIKV